MIGFPEHHSTTPDVRGFLSTGNKLTVTDARHGSPEATPERSLYSCAFSLAKPSSRAFSVTQRTDVWFLRLLIDLIHLCSAFLFYLCPNLSFFYILREIKHK